jgi:hypothetical protein
MGVNRTVVPGEQAHPIKPHQMRVIIFDTARPEDANLGGVNNSHDPHG